LRVLCLLPTHLTFNAIAEQHGRRRSTVKAHVEHIYKKLGASNRGEAVARARESGLLVAGMRAANRSEGKRDDRSSGRESFARLTGAGICCAIFALGKYVVAGEYLLLGAIVTIVVVMGSCWSWANGRVEAPRASRSAVAPSGTPARSRRAMNSSPTASKEWL
jgi:DNA-binding CsgD family transcriptional regulator